MHLIHPSRFCMCNAQVYPVFYSVKYRCNFQTLSSPYVVCFCLRGDSMRLNGSYCRTVRLCDMVSHLQLTKCQRNCICYEFIYMYMYIYISISCRVFVRRSYPKPPRGGCWRPVQLSRRRLVVATERQGLLRGNGEFEHFIGICSSHLSD